MTFGEAEKWSVIASGEGAGGNGVRGSSPVSPVTSRCISYSSPPCPKSWPSIIQSSSVLVQLLHSSKIGTALSLFLLLVLHIILVIWFFQWTYSSINFILFRSYFLVLRPGSTEMKRSLLFLLEMDVTLPEIALGKIACSCQLQPNVCKGNKLHFFNLRRDSFSIWEVAWEDRR